MERFWAKVQKRGPEDCWEWGAYRMPEGYGMFWYRKKMQIASRVSYIISVGAVKKNMFVLHRCDNPACVNPAHLFIGTKQDNANDMLFKKRCYNQRKTHCPAGHALSGANCYTYPNGRRRICRTCNNASHNTRRKRV